MMTRCCAVKQLLTMPLDPVLLSGENDPRETEGMEGKAKFIFPILATGFIVLVVSSVVTFANIGIRADFVRRWLTAYIIGWPIGAVSGMIAFPYIRRATVLIVGLIERT